MSWAERPKGQEVGGYKADTGKPRMSLLPSSPLRVAADTFGYGMEKYAIEDKAYANNWLGGMKFSQMASAMLRHYHAWWDGEDDDDESGIHHLGHALACLLMLTEYALKPELYAHLDDRPTTENILKYHAHLQDEYEKRAAEENTDSTEGIMSFYLADLSEIDHD